MKTHDRMTRPDRMGLKKTFSPHESLHRGMMVAGAFYTNFLNAYESMPSSNATGGL